jgi:hypothetical protein
MSQFQLHGEWYDFVDPSDLDGEELDLLERYTAANMVEQRFSMWGLMWISVRRRVANTTWDDIKKEKLLKCEWRPSPGEEDAESLPPTNSGDAESSTADDQTPQPGLTDIGSRG